MRIAILNITGGGMSGGYKKYLVNIAPKLAKNKNVKSILFVAPVSLKMRNLIKKHKKIKFFNTKPFRFMRHELESKLKQALNKFNPDVVFVPFERYFEFNKPKVIMIQNMWPIAGNARGYPLYSKLRFWALLAELKFALKKADKVIAISNFVKTNLIRKFKISDNRLDLIYFGINIPGKNTKYRKPEIIPKTWEKDFLFTAGSIEPNRGLEDIFLSMILDKNIKLIIAGRVVRPDVKSYFKKMKIWIEKNNLKSRTIFTGNLKEAEMNWCYKNCKVFVMTSRIEALPNIALEALSHGCLCVAADNAPLPEIFKDAALFYSPCKSRELNEKIKKILSLSIKGREKMRLKARKRAKDFSWDVAAKKTLEVFKKTIQESKNEK